MSVTSPTKHPTSPTPATALPTSIWPSFVGTQAYAKRQTRAAKVAFSDPPRSIKLRMLICTHLSLINCNLSPLGIGGLDSMPMVCCPLLMLLDSRLSVTTWNTLWLRLLWLFQSMVTIRRTSQPHATTSCMPTTPLGAALAIHSCRYLGAVLWGLKRE
jgi:hypothetical protein